MLFDFLTIGGLTEDIVFFTDEGILVDNKGDILRQKLLAFENGAKIKVRDLESHFGGGASNTAVNLSNLGFKSACLAHVGGDDRGKKIMANLKRKNVNIRFIEKISKLKSGLSFILNNKKDRIIFTFRGANDNLIISEKHGKIIKNSAWVYLTSLPDNYSSSLNTIFKFKNKIAWNPGLNQLSGGAVKIKKFLKKTDILMLNKDEALELLKNSNDFSDLKDSFLSKSINIVKLLKLLGPEKIVLTDGTKGAYFYDGKNFYHQAIIKGQGRIDSTGVGDAFTSTFVAFLEILEGDFKKAMFMGAKNTASVVSKFGAQNGLLSLNNLIYN